MKSFWGKNDTYCIRQKLPSTSYRFGPYPSSGSNLSYLTDFIYIFLIELIQVISAVSQWTPKGRIDTIFPKGLLCLKANV